MAASDIIAYGFGSWSTAAKMPTLGFTSGVASVGQITGTTVAKTRLSGTIEWQSRLGGEVVIRSRLGGTARNL
jgi:hypothetical protein